MKCVVTGAAGFIGSHLCEKLLHDGHEVVGLDAFIPYYPRAVKERNLSAARAHPRFRFAEADLRRDPLETLVDGAEAVFHLAAMPGLTRSCSTAARVPAPNFLPGTQRQLRPRQG